MARVNYGIFSGCGEGRELEAVRAKSVVKYAVKTNTGVCHLLSLLNQMPVDVISNPKSS